MYSYSIENEIYARIKKLSGAQKEQLLNVIEHFEGRDSTRLHRRKAMRQIREALTGGQVPA